MTNDLEEVHVGVYSENADDMVPAINALATTNPNLAAFDMDTVPTNDNVVNAIASAFPQLTFFSTLLSDFPEIFPHKLYSIITRGSPQGGEQKIGVSRTHEGY